MNDVTKRCKLTAILYADAQGYSRLMGEDEESTVETITRYRRLFSRCIGDCGGRVVNAPGDSILAEFASAVEAVQCSINIQEQLASANDELPDFRRMFFRIGMNLGDVIQKGEELYGDGVNIAARVAAMAEAGGICITRSVFDQVKNQLPEVKGFLDLAQLMARPGVEAHCSQLMGSPVRVDDRESIIDDKARKAYESRIRELQEEIADAEAMNDLGRSESLEKELDQLTDHLSKALGMGGKMRTVNAPVDRARSAVTWRIRSAIRKIKAAHPALGSHLSNSIRTGTFCSYSPEKDQIWQIERM